MSAARTAKPSTVERGNPGNASGAVTSTAGTRRNKSASATLLHRGAPRRPEPSQRLGNGTGGEELPAAHREGWPEAPSGFGCGRAAAPPCSTPAR